jgi:hypothetical protein
MSHKVKTNLQLLYRYICKNFTHANNTQIFKNYIREEIHSFNSKSFTNEVERMIKISEWNELIKNYNKMNYHIDKENELLASYNINVVRDNKTQIEDIAHRVGLQV